MLSVTRPSIKKNLYKLDEYASDARTRSNGYDRVADELGVPVEFIRNAALRGGLPSVLRLRTVLTPRQEEMFVSECLVYARQVPHSQFQFFVKYQGLLLEEMRTILFFSSSNKHCDK